MHWLHNRWLRLGLLPVALAVCGGTPVIAENRLEGGQFSQRGDADWRTRPKSAMGLGLPADRWTTGEASAPPDRQADRCKKWQAVADRLGETYAGHTLRRTLVRRHCEMLGAQAVVSGRWEWPWNGLERGRTLPPRAHRDYGSWSIRCGAGPARRRCALVQVASATQADGAAHSTITTHFVIDRVGGREVLLWRVFVPRAPAPATALAALVHDDVGVSSAMPVAVRAAGEVRFKLGPVQPWERFPVCSATGCLIEVGAERAGAAATTLADGRPVTLDVRHGDGGVSPVTLEAGEFHTALIELIRLRRAERRPEVAR